MLQVVVQVGSALTDDRSGWDFTVLVYNVQHDNIADFILDIASGTKNIPMIRSHLKQDEPLRRLYVIVPRHVSTSPMLTAETSSLMEVDRLLDTS